MSLLSGYEPQKALAFFEELCAIPHGSGHTKAISDHLVSFAKERGLAFRQDDLGNVIIKKPASLGYEDHPTVILQGHMDMVAVKTADCPKDLEKEGLDLEISEGFLSARGTSLGGDDGIAIAYALAILDDETLPHPPLEFVATVDEELGMLGATGLDASDLEGRLLLNIDSEDEGIFTVSCAGGLTALCRFPIQREKLCGLAMTVRLDGLLGGHSGTEIDKGRLSAIRALGRLLKATEDLPVRLMSLSGGEKDNAIARFAEAELLVLPEAEEDRVRERLEAVFADICREYETIEKDLSLEIETEEEAEPMEALVLTAESAHRALSALIILPNGVVRRNPDIPSLVQTSLNMGILETRGAEVILTLSLRSPAATEKYFLLDRVRSLMELLGASCIVEGDYPGWAYRPDSRLRETMTAVYRELYGSEPVVEGIHAGLECGIFAAKLPGLDAISFGPQIEDIHTTSERLDLSSVERTWHLLTETLKRL